MIMQGSLGKSAALVVVGLALAGCGNDTARNESSQYFGGVAKSLAHDATGLFKKAPPATRPNPEAMAVSALASNKGPLIQVTGESTGYVAVLGLTGENGAMRTYFSSDKAAVILRNGMLAGTRGYGVDLMSADTTATERLIRARQSGTAPKVMRVLDGQERERPIPMTCHITPGKAVSYPFAGQTWAGTQVIEQCTTEGAKITNSYVVASSGAIVASRQWASPQLGYFTIQTVRP